jgi:hypothetical protein
MDSATMIDRANQLIAALRASDASRAVLAYDRDSDELIVAFDGNERPGVGRPVGDGWLLRLDRETGEPIGFQVESFLAVATALHPMLLDLLDFAELRGITVEEVALLRRELAAKHRSAAFQGVRRTIPPAAVAAG